MRDAALMCEDLGAQAVDINMGCPVRKVTQIGGGSAMMTELGRTAGPGARDGEGGPDPRDGQDAPRLGLGEHHGPRPRARARGGGRLRRLRPRAHARAGVLGRSSTSRASAPSWARSGRSRHRQRRHHDAGGRPAHDRRDRMRRREHRARGVLRPLDLPQDGPFLRTGELLPEPGFAERIRVLRRHFERYCEFYGEARGARLFRKVAPGTQSGSARRSRSSSGSSPLSRRADFESVLSEYVAWRAAFCDPSGELLQKYRPAPMSPSFADAG
jgi:tRNA-dihydrouridine synthase B